MPLTDDQLTELWDKQALHDNLMLYVRSADRQDRELMLSTYWEDSTDDHGGIFVGTGPGWVDKAMTYSESGGSLLSCNHHMGNVLSEIDGNRAKRESMFTVVNVWKDPEVMTFLGGRYRDLCEKRDGEWKILHRTCVWDWLETRPVKADFEFMGIPRVTHWGNTYPNDPIYLDWTGSERTEYPHPSTFWGGTP